MKKPHRESEARDNSTGGTVDCIVAAGSPCPSAPECRRRWIVNGVTETATCAHCYQLLTRTDMARILTGRI